MLSECPEIPLTLSYVDCEDFPCMAWFQSRGGQVQQALRDCPFWRERYANPAVTSASGDLVGPDGETLRYWGLGEVPRGVREMGDQENRKLRFDLRIQSARERFMADWGARELNGEERHQRQLEFWRSLADEGHEGAAEMLETLEGTEN